MPREEGVGYTEAVRATGGGVGIMGGAQRESEREREGKEFV
jgi:hypothetical protein